VILSQEQEMIRDLARNFVQNEISPFAQQWEQSEQIPVHVLKALGQIGLMGMTTPTEWGGSEADLVSYIIATEELAAGDCGVCNMMNVHNSPVCAVLRDYGTPEQKNNLLPDMASGALFGAFLLTEPEAGSDASALTTKAVLKGDKYILNGTKQFITGGSTADVAMIIAVTDPSLGRKGMTCFMTKTDNIGYKVARIEKKLGHRNNDTCQILLDNMEVPIEDVIGMPGEGYKIALANLETGRIAVAAQAVGVARAALDASIKYANERKSFGKHLIEHQAIAFKLAEMATQVAAARQMVLHAAQLKDAKLPSLKDASMAKLFASEMAEKVCSDAIQIHGGYGYLSDFPVEKYYRDARVLQIYEGSSEVQKMLISRAQLYRAS
jgi:alkylation response protein AidB-like acyl-CoA dehydrogenase